MEVQECCLPAGELEGKVVSPHRKESGTQQKVWLYFGLLAECDNAVFLKQERQISLWGIT